MSMPFTVLFVCTGNTCRSPMAQMLLRDKLARRGLGGAVNVISAGLAGFSGDAISFGAQQALAALGIEAGAHRSRSLAPGLLDEAGAVITMSRGHLAELLRIYPEARGKAFTLAEFCGQGQDIADPFGGDAQMYAACAGEIDGMLEAGLEKFIAFTGAKRMKLIIGSDHGGYPLKEELKELLRELAVDFEDCGVHSLQAADYPLVAREVAGRVADGQFDRGILICGTGIGVCIAANKVQGIRAALCGDVFSAQMSREHNDANILCLGARVVGRGLAGMIVKVWLESGFAGGRHARRVDMIERLP